MKKIAFFTENLKVGGIQKSIVNLLNNLDYKKYEVDLYLFDKDIFFKNQIPAYVNIIYLNKNNPICKFIPFNLAFAFKKTSITKEYDIAIDFDSYQFDTALNCIKCNSKRKIMWIHNDVKKEYDYQLKYKILHFFMKPKYKYFNEFVGVSEGVIPPFKELNKVNKKFYVIPNFVNTNEIIEKSNEKIMMEVDPNKYNLITVGRICYQKGFDILLKDIKKLKEYRQDFYLYIIGDGDKMQELKDYVQKNNISSFVTFLGKQVNPYKYMKMMDGFVLTSRFEGQGIVILEAKTLGLDIFIPKDLEKYVGCNIKGKTDIVKALSNAKKTSHKTDLLISYNEKIKQSIEKIFN